LRVIRALVAIALILGFWAGCTGDGGGRPTGAASSAFTDTTCVDVAVWTKAIQPAFIDLQSIGSFDASNATAAQDQLKKLSVELTNAEQATATLADSINARNAPNISSGGDIKKSVVAALNRLRDAGGKIRAKIDVFNVATATKEESATLKADLTQLTNDATESVSALAPLLTNNSELRAALENSATCRQAGSGVFSS
jgi:hypothetical protein